MKQQGQNLRPLTATDDTIQICNIVDGHDGSLDNKQNEINIQNFQFRKGREFVISFKKDTLGKMPNTCNNIFMPREVSFNDLDYLVMQSSLFPTHMDSWNGLSLMWWFLEVYFCLIFAAVQFNVHQIPFM